MRTLFLILILILTACAAQPVDEYLCGTKYDVLVDRSRPERAWAESDIKRRFDSDRCFRACADPLTGTVHVATGWDWDWVVQHEICHLKWAHTYHSQLDNKPRGFAGAMWAKDHRRDGKYQRNE